MRRLAVNDARSGEVQALAVSLPDPYTLDNWLRRVWEIVPDPSFAEFVRSPAYMIRSGRFEGDCDDAATLAASVLTALGYPVLLVAIRLLSEPEFSHVFARVPSRPPLDIDPIVPTEHLPIRYGEAMVLPV
jgi:hypothetical protein